jgi:hypothetical protein
LVDICAKEYKENPRPRKLGELYCFMYDKNNYPRIVIGPDWYYSVIAACFFNIVGTGFMLYPPAASGRWDLLAGGVLVMLL